MPLFLTQVTISDLSRIPGFPDEVFMGGGGNPGSTHAKMATLKKIMKGATTPFVFKEDVTEQPRRRPNRVARSGR